MLRAGIVSVTFRSETPETIVEWTRQAGLQGIEWGGDVHVPHGHIRRARRVGRLTEGAGMAVVSYGSYYRFSEISGGSTDDFSSLLDTVEALGTRVVRVWAGVRGSAQTPAGERARLVESIRRCADEALARGVVLAFEYHRNSLTDTYESAARLFREVNHPSVRSLWQPPHDRTPARCEEELRALVPVLEHIHCFHWEQMGHMDKRPLNEGTEAWLRYLRAVAEATPADRQRWVLLEFLPEETKVDLLRDADVLRAWIDTVEANQQM